MVKDDMSDPLEFNDGVGDMLRFGKRQRKKWWRLPLLTIIGIIILSISFVLSYELGKILFLPKTNNKSFVPDTVNEPQFDKLQEEFAYKETKEPTKNIKADLTVSKNAEKQKNKEEKKEKVPTKSIDTQKEKPKKDIKSKEEKIPTKSIQKIKDKTKIKAKETNPTKNETITTKEINYKVIVGAYSKKEKALEEAKSLLDKGFSAYVWQSGNVWKIQIGSFKSKENADALKNKVEANGHKAIVISD